MSEDGGIFVLCAKQPGAERFQSVIAAKHDFSGAAGTGTRRFGERLLIPSVALRTPTPALIARGTGGQNLVFTRLAHRLGNDEVGYVPGLTAPRFEAPLTFGGLVGSEAFFTLRYTVLGGFEIEKDKLVDRFLGYFRK